MRSLLNHDREATMVQSPSEMETLSLELPRAIALHVSPEQFEVIALANFYAIAFYGLHHYF